MNKNISLKDIGRPALLMLSFYIVVIVLSLFTTLEGELFSLSYYRTMKIFAIFLVIGASLCIWTLIADRRKTVKVVSLVISLYYVLYLPHYLEPEYIASKIRYRIISAENADLFLWHKERLEKNQKVWKLLSNFSFEDQRTDDVFMDKYAPLDIDPYICPQVDTKDINLNYEGQIIPGVAEANFAGHYILLTKIQHSNVSRSCIVDLHTGKSYTGTVGSHHEFRSHSRLLVTYDLNHDLDYVTDIPMYYGHFIPTVYFWNEKKKWLEYVDGGMFFDEKPANITDTPPAIDLAKLRGIEDTVPENELQSAIKNRDYRFMAIQGYGLSVPYAGEYFPAYVDSFGIKPIEGTSDMILGKEHYRLQFIAINFATRYNQLLVSYLRKMTGNLKKTKKAI